MADPTIKRTHIHFAIQSFEFAEENPSPKTAIGNYSRLSSSNYMTNLNEGARTCMVALAFERAKGGGGETERGGGDT